MKLTSVAKLSENPAFLKQESDNLKENCVGSNSNMGSVGDVAKNNRPKKFRPSQSSAVKKSAAMMLESTQDAIEI